MLVIFSGGSGVGKNTVISALLKSGDFVLMPTYTTRTPRPNESEGNPYCFIDEATFLKKIDEGELYEHENVHGHYYGTSRKLLAAAEATGKILLKDIDVLGTQRLVESIGDDIKIVPVFLKVDSKEILVERLKGRNETEIEKRLLRYDMEQTYQINYSYVINNVDLEKTKGYLVDLIRTEKENLSFLTATEKEIDGQKTEDCISLLSRGEKAAPVKIGFWEGVPYILEGQERYLASLRTGKTVAKEICPLSEKPTANQAEWAKLVEMALYP